MIKTEQFDNAIGDFPPSTIDVGAIVARQERKRTVRRRGSALFGVAMLVLAISVVAGLGLKAPPDPGLTAQTSGPVSPSPSLVAEAPAAKAERVQAAWLRAVEAVLPQATWRAGHDGSHEKPSRGDYFDQVAGPKPPPMFTRTNDVNGRPLVDSQGNLLDVSQWPIGEYLYHTFGIVKVGSVGGRFTVRTEWRGGPGYQPYSRCSTGTDAVMTCSDDFFCVKEAECERSTGPNGEAVFTVLETQQLEDYRLPYKSLLVWIRSADGTRTIEMSITNRAGGDLGPAPDTTELALTKEQILRILLEPGLMI
jgi:hypothetical protein